jgi:NAD(P)-dependent dehydrogenase (short-subunit alcohol dehydrogenase family)
MTARFADKTAIVTGATGGIGTAVAERLAGEGARVVICARSKDAGRALAERLGGVFVAGDVRDPSTATSAIAAAGRLDVLVNNAGVDHAGELLTVPPDEVRDVLEINFMGACWFLQAAGRSMATSGGGAIVNITSRHATAGIAQAAVYGASKGALLALTRSAAVELAPRGIRVNAVAPGCVATPMLDAWLADRHGAARVVAAIPQGRIGEPREVASAVAYLASDEAAYITGVSLAVDGGLAA